jgi:S1-C subfamily serine protease
VGVIGFAGTGSAGGAAGERPKLSVGDPTSAWGRAGLRTGDQVISVNRKAIADARDFRAALAPVRIGDHVRVEYLRGGEHRRADVTIAGYDVVEVALEALPRLSAHQRAMRRAWLSGTPR